MSDPESYAKAMLSSYERWEKSDEGKEYEAKFGDKKAVKITEELPDGWEISEETNSYFIYEGPDYWQINIEAYFDTPIHMGGYPTRHFVAVTLVDPDGDLEGEQIAKFSVHELGWDEAWKKANERALEEMRNLKPRRRW